MHYLIISVFSGVTVAKKNNLRGAIDVLGIATMQLRQKEVGFFCRIQNYRGLSCRPLLVKHVWTRKIRCINK